MGHIRTSSAKKILIPLMALVCTLFFTGCYTKLMSYQGETLPGRSGGSGCAECSDEVAPTADRREICVWERDIFGYPEMRCYNTFYHSSWIYFHNTPWWYRNSYSWYDTRGCPPHYYFDRISGMCRLIGPSRYPPANDGMGGGGGGVAHGDPQPRRNSRGTPPTSESATVEPSTPMFTGGPLAPLSPVSAPSVTTPSVSAPSSQRSDQATTDSPPSSSQPHQPQQEAEKRPAVDNNNQSPPPRRSTRGTPR